MGRADGQDARRLEYSVNVFARVDVSEFDPDPGGATLRIEAGSGR